MSSSSSLDHSDAGGSRQKQTGEMVRRRSREKLVLGAAEVFAENGYAGATVSAIADRAGVSLQTLYSAWGSKRRLLRAYVEFTLTGSPTAVTDGTWVPQAQALVDPAALSDPRLRVRRIATIFRRTSERMGVAWRIHRDGAAIDPGVAEDHAELELLRRRTMAGLLDGIDEAGLRAGMTLDRAIDTLLVIASPSTFDALVTQCGYSMDEFENWLAVTLEAALLPDLPTP